MSKSGSGKISGSTAPFGRRSVRLQNQPSGEQRNEQSDFPNGINVSLSESKFLLNLTDGRRKIFMPHQDFAC
jgi:hypothetical protein